MANDSWAVVFQYTPNNETTNIDIPIYFLSTGEIDFTRTSELSLNIIEIILKPSLNSLKEVATKRGVDVDFWKLVNFIFVTYHWLILANLGQTSPTIYAPIVFPAAPEWYRVNFTQVRSYPPTNNILVNETLYDIYTGYLGETILPLLNYSSPEFTPLGDANRLQLEETTFIKSYNCQVRKWKSPLVALFSIVTTATVFITTPYGIVILIATRVQKRNPKG